jgi:hypothetical protein
VLRFHALAVWRVLCFSDEMATDPYVPPKWGKPSPLGYGAATESVGGVAAPLLAGFSLSSLLVVAADRDHFRWPGLTSLLFTVTATLLITTVQCWFRARSHLWSPADVSNWWPDMNPDREKQLRFEQQKNLRRWERWVFWQRLTYDAGVVALFAATATALVPTVGAFQPVLRWVAVTVAATGGVGELTWHFIDSRDGRP